MAGNRKAFLGYPALHFHRDRLHLHGDRLHRSGLPCSPCTKTVAVVMKTVVVEKNRAPHGEIGFSSFFPRQKNIHRKRSSKGFFVILLPIYTISTPGLITDFNCRWSKRKTKKVSFLGDTFISYNRQRLNSQTVLLSSASE